MSEADLSSRLGSLGIQIEPDWSGGIQRDKAQWLVSHSFNHGGRVFKLCTFGDWKSGAKETWKSWLNGAGEDPVVRAQVEARLRAQNEARRKAKHDYQEKQAIKLWDQWRGFQKGPVEWSPYLVKKQIPELFGARLEVALTQTNTIVPMVDIDNKFWNFQRITLTEKRFNFDARVKGCFHVLEGSGLVGLEESHEIYICEGFATAASVACALRLGGEEAQNAGRVGISEDPFKRGGPPSVVCAFDAHNLPVAAQAIHQRFPHKAYVLCGDNDAHNGTNRNTGVDAVHAAHRALGPTSTFVYPRFKEPQKGRSDFNDLAMVEGLPETYRQLLTLRERLNPAPETESESSSADADSPPPDGGGEAPKKAKRQKYDAFKRFFDDLLPEAKRDVVSGRLVEFDGGQWQSVVGRLGEIKSRAGDKGLNDSKVKDHLERFINEQPKALLVNMVPWDGVDRIQGLSEWIDFKGAGAFDVFADAMKEWGANVFRRLYHQGAQNRCIILKGDQGIGKDYLIRSMLQSFGPYYAKFTNSRDEREIWDQVTGRLVVHIEEFEQTGSMTIAFLKDLITRDWATYRSPYAHDASTRKCVGSFISTANINAPLRDSTGNRRFAVFEVAAIRWGYPQDWGPQIMAQFKALFDADFRAKKETWEYVLNSNEKFEMVDIVPEILAEWDARLSTIYHHGEFRGKKEVTFEEISGTCTDLAKQFGYSLQKLLTVVKSSGRSRRSHGVTRYWSNLIKVPAGTRVPEGCEYPGEYPISH